MDRGRGPGQGRRLALALPQLLHAFQNAGLELERFAEGGAPVPIVLALRAGRFMIDSDSLRRVAV